MRKPKPFALTNLRKTMVPVANCQQVFNPILAFVQTVANGAGVRDGAGARDGACREPVRGFSPIPCRNIRVIFREKFS